MNPEFTAPHTVRMSAEGVRYTFYCDLTGEPVFTTAPIAHCTPQEELACAIAEARPHFNRCIRCGKWICDNAYSIDEMLCIRCAQQQKKERWRLG